MKKNLKYIIFFLLTIVIICVFLASSKDLKSVIEALENVNVKYLLLSILIVIFYLFFLNLSIDVLAKKMLSINFFLSHNISNQMNFYNGVTPFQCGGQAMALYYYHKYNFDMKKSSSILMMNFIIYQITIVLFGILALGCYFSYLKSFVSNFSVLAIIGFVINFSILIGLVLISTLKCVKAFVDKLLTLIGKIKPLKNKMESTKKNVEEFINDFQSNFKFLLKNPLILISSLFLKIIALSFSFMIPFFTLRAVNINLGIEQIFFIICMTASCTIFMSFLPTPGGMGGAEWALSTILCSIAGVNSVMSLSATLLWRFVAYYMVLILGFISVIILRIIKPKEELPNDNRNVY